MESLRLPLSVRAPKVTPAISPFHLPRTYAPSRKNTPTTQSTITHSFLDLKCEPKLELLDMGLPWHVASNRSEYDVVIVGGGPAGLRLAEQVSGYGIEVCCIDPSPLSLWPNNYGVWVDEFQTLDLVDCLDKTWHMATVFIDDHKTKYLDRPYGRVSRKKLKSKLMETCAVQGVRFHKAKAWEVVHQEFKSTVRCDDGCDVKGSLVVDASGYSSSFVQYKKPRNHGYQIAHGILAEVEGHPFDLDKAVLMDWRDSHMSNEPSLRVSNAQIPTFLYVMPFNSNLVFLEETSLVSRPIMSYAEIKNRMVARLRHLGIKVKRAIEEEKCVIPMGGPLPSIPQNVVAVGGTAGLVHPSTGYTLARAMSTAPLLADVIAECLGSTRMIRGNQLRNRAWSGLWPMEKRLEREFYRFGMETLLQLDLKGTRRFFDAFFDLDPYYWQGFLSSRLSLGDLAMLSMSLFVHASNPSRFDIVTKCPLPLAKMMGNLAVEAI